MPVQFGPVAVFALRAAALGAAVALVARRRARLPEEGRERVLDDLPEGVDLDAGREPEGALRADGAARVARTIRLGLAGRAVRIEAAALARLRIGPAGQEG
ncbi:MAG: hypothetical protein ACPGID_11220 [Rubricella sp.]